MCCCWPFLFVLTNILLIKIKLKLVSRAIAVGAAMSPRNLGGKYRCRPHPQPRKFTRQFFLWEAQRVNRTAPASLLDDRDNIVDHVVCLKAEFLQHTVLSIENAENGEFYTYGIYPYLNRSVCLLRGSPTWWRFSFCSSGSSLVCSVMGDSSIFRMVAGPKVHWSKNRALVRMVNSPTGW